MVKLDYYHCLRKEIEALVTSGNVEAAKTAAKQVAKDAANKIADNAGNEDAAERERISGFLGDAVKAIDNDGFDMALENAEKALDIL